MNLKNGFYWVKELSETAKWQIAYYDNKHFWLTGWECSVNADELEVGDRIFVPIKYQPIVGQEI